MYAAIVIPIEQSKVFKPIVQTKSGWPRHREIRENREFGSYFFQTGKTQGILF